ncbi:MAG: hypothetical protein ACI8PZ_006706 [Myxococcota bacterium]|jgi:hypothetical protein
MRFTTTAGLGIAAMMFASGCDYTGDWLFAGEVEGLPGVWHMEDQDQRLIVPRVVTTYEELQDATIYAEVGPSGTTELGGVTIEFEGNGSDICVWVDPETVWWNQAVNPSAVGAAEFWTYPDNVYDDGDLDLYVGLSVYYTGSPGERLGDFVVSYEDSLGNEVPIQLAECRNNGAQEGIDAHAGRAMPEYCNIRDTQPGISYTAVLQTFSTPVDDDRLGFGLLITEGSCEDLRSLAAGAGFASTNYRLEECVIMGESMVAQKGDFGPWYGKSSITSWAESEAFEAHFCSDKNMRSYCRKESDDKLGNGGSGCSWSDAPGENDRCFCGDETDTPQGGAF